MTWMHNALAAAALALPLAHTGVIGGGESTSVTFSASILAQGGDYSYLCTFPGHSALMHGRFRFG